MSMQTGMAENAANPLDSVEDILIANNWVFNRMTDCELMVQVSGRKCNYRLFFLWQQETGAMQFCCQYDISVDPQNLESAAPAVLKINEKLWLGHFDLPQDTGIPSFRYACLLRGLEENCADRIEDLVDISLAQCERHFPVFHLLSLPAAQAHDQDLSLALLETLGEA